MADDRRVSVENKNIVHSVHEKLRKEIHEIAERKSWSAKQKEEFEKKLCELYQHSVEDTIKANITIGGQEWNDAIPEVSSNSVIREEMEPINKDRVAQVFAICSEFEDLLKETTCKRKKYPQQITERMRIILASRKEMLENYQSLLKNDSSLSSSHALTSASEFEEYIQRFETACQEIPQLSKSFQDLQEKAFRLQQAVSCHSAVCKSETDAILFGRDNNNVSSPQKIDSQSNNENVAWWEGLKQKSQPAQRQIAAQNA
ncbi:kinetochore-associated protein NSL1 homolog [Montipora foliosa]|uniref:kinetochore-associated protein NSL1 homolog n=1 Tax=Montipora foliosa TaxID=591990 RepID=UPI0035F1F476